LAPGNPTLSPGHPLELQWVRSQFGPSRSHVLVECCIYCTTFKVCSVWRSWTSDSSRTPDRLPHDGQKCVVECSVIDWHYPQQTRDCHRRTTADSQSVVLSSLPSTLLLLLLTIIDNDRFACSDVARHHYAVASIYRPPCMQFDAHYRRLSKMAIKGVWWAVDAS